jgi:hypothetical protein
VAPTAFNADYDQRRAACQARNDHALLESFYVNRRQRLSRHSRILEFGCELTGGSFWLANSKQFVIADITPATLQICAGYAQQRGIRDVQFVLLRHSQDLDALAPCDLLYSALSLKRIPPSTMVDILSLLLSKVTKGGVAVVHAPTGHRHKTLMVENTSSELELYLIPQWILSETFKQRGFEIALIQETVCYRSSDIIYHTFLVERIFTPPTW